MAAAVFESLWFERCRVLMLETAGALALVSRLCGDPDTVEHVLAGDPAARHQMRDAFLHLGAVSGRFDELGPPPPRLAPIAGIAQRALSAFSEAAGEFSEGIEGGIDVETMQRVSRHIHVADAVLGELGERPELKHGDARADEPG